MSRGTRSRQVLLKARRARCPSSRGGCRQPGTAAQLHLLHQRLPGRGQGGARPKQGQTQWKFPLEMSGDSGTRLGTTGMEGLGPESPRQHPTGIIPPAAWGCCPACGASLGWGVRPWEQDPSQHSHWSWGRLLPVGQATLQGAQGCGISPGAAKGKGHHGQGAAQNHTQLCCPQPQVLSSLLSLLESLSGAEHGACRHTENIQDRHCPPQIPLPTTAHASQPRWCWLKALSCPPLCPILLLFPPLSH